MTTGLYPLDNGYLCHKCPNCHKYVVYFSMEWHTVRTRRGDFLRRRMGPCSHCEVWVKPILVWDGTTGWLCECVDHFEGEQVEISRMANGARSSRSSGSSSRWRAGNRARARSAHRGS
jgi:hypothetical protein